MINREATASIALTRTALFTSRQNRNTSATVWLHPTRVRNSFVTCGSLQMPHPIDWPLALPYAAALVTGYLLGSIPFGLILTRCAGTPDIRSIGSGNIGATNVLRTGSKALAVATLIADTLQGTVAVLPAHAAFRPYPPRAAAAGALIGHIFPVWLKFKGGKGVATYIGLLIGLAWPAAGAFCLIWLAIAALTRFSLLP